MFDPKKDLLAYSVEISDNDIFDPNAPTIVQGDGTKIWKNKDDQIHRDNGPAIEQFDGTRIWYQLDKISNLNGPAIIQKDGTKRYLIEGKEFSKTEWERKRN